MNTRNPAGVCQARPDDVDLNRVVKVEHTPRFAVNKFNGNLFTATQRLAAVATNLVAAGILTGCRKLSQKYRRKAPPQQSAVTSPLSPEDLFSKHAGGITTGRW